MTVKPIGVASITLATLLCSLPDARGQSPGWTNVTPASAWGRYRCGMAFDSARNRTVLFGGHNDYSNMNDLWEWDNHSWTYRNIQGPLPRSEFGMTFDLLRNKVLLVGGHDGASSQSDTWALDGIT